MNFENIKCFVCLLYFIELTLTQRRIKHGELVTTEKRYMVYLVKASSSPQQYIGWLCGGAIVSTWHIVSSAACVEDVEHLFAIAGYKKYIKPIDIDQDLCTKEKKKKIVFTCVPKMYEFAYNKIEKWAHIDIAVLKVESPYDFNDQTYLSTCSYIPNKIDINYERKYQEPGTDALVLGWGHEDGWRMVGDSRIYNSNELRYAPVLLVEKEICKDNYSKYPSLVNTIDAYMICSNGPGNINEHGQRINTNIPKSSLLNGCYKEKILRGSPGEICAEYYKNAYDYNYGYNNEEEETVYDLKHEMLQLEMKPIETDSENKGFCQNDHGGPLVTWAGAQEILIGVATAFRINENSKCVGPFLYTSTQCSGAFLDCIINSDNITSERRALCESPAKRGYDLIERTISWIDHPSGPAASELLEERPQLPLRDVNKKEVY